LRYKGTAALPIHTDRREAIDVVSEHAAVGATDVPNRRRLTASIYDVRAASVDEARERSYVHLHVGIVGDASAIQV
jgi:hypothetical protein